MYIAKFLSHFYFVVCYCLCVCVLFHYSNAFDQIRYNTDHGDDKFAFVLSENEYLLVEIP